MNEVFVEEEEGVAFVHPRRRAALNISEGTGDEGGGSRVELYEKMMSNDVFEVRGESKYEFRTVSAQWTLRGWGVRWWTLRIAIVIFHS